MLKLSMRISAFTIVLTAMSACGTLVTPDELTKPAVAESLTLPVDVFYTFQGDKPVNERYYTGLLAGRYVAEWVNARGTYYRGRGEAVVYADDPAKQIRHVAQGGLLVSKEGVSPRYTLYRYLGSEKVQRRGGVPGAPATPSSGPIRAPIAGALKDIDTSIFVTGSPTPLQAGLGVGIAAGIIELTKDMDKGKIALQKPSTPVGTFEDKFTRP